MDRKICYLFHKFILYFGENHPKCYFILIMGFAPRVVRFAPLKLMLVQPNTHKCFSLFHLPNKLLILQVVCAQYVVFSGSYYTFKFISETLYYFFFHLYFCVYGFSPNTMQAPLI